MTILPKKKQGKEKTDPEKQDLPLGHHNHGHHHPGNSETRHDKGARGRTSPTRWLPGATREDKHQNHDPGGVFDSHDVVVSGHNKRRHRTSPHRSHGRKHRGGGGHGGQVHPQTPPHVPQASPSETFEETGYNSGDEYVASAHPENIEELEKWFEEGLKEKRGLIIKRMGEDGACLFRSVADQVYGDEEVHSTVRRNIIDYMAKNADYYSQYVTEDFTTYLNRKRMDNVHGNHLEMQAMCEIYNRPIEVYQYSLDPINTFQCSYKTDNEPIRISYHRNVHYNSIVDPYKQTIGVGLGFPNAKFQPLIPEKHLVRDATKQSEEHHLEHAMLQDKIRETDWEVTQETIEEQVARESYLQWLRDNEKRARRPETPRTASATCSSSTEYTAQMEDPDAPDTRPCRSPRNKSSSTNTSNQNSPQRMEVCDLPMAMPTLEPKVSPNGSPKPSPGQTASAPAGKDPEISQGATGGFDFETHSTMNQYPESIYADLANWDEDDLLAQVMAQSQQDYLDSLKKNVNTASSSSSTTVPSFSSPSSSSSSYPDLPSDQPSSSTKSGRGVS